MTLRDAIAAAGLTPPRDIPQNRFVRFPGAGKSRSNRAGWCKLLSPTVAVFGDWSTGLWETWTDASHLDCAESQRQIAAAKDSMRAAAAIQRQRQREAASAAQGMMAKATTCQHPYLARKGFPFREGLVLGEDLLIPIRAVEDYDRVISMQSIDTEGKKLFVKGSRTRGGIHRLGNPRARPVLCEGYATALSISEALRRLPGPHAVIACFSAFNLEIVAQSFPSALICADNDQSKAGEQAAIRTGRRWVMPPEVGDFNDMHQRKGLHAVAMMMRDRMQA
jgi:putative DNA primase/helicase